MAAKRVPAGRDQLAPVIRATAIVYVWAEEENYWPAPAAGSGGDPEGPFSPGSSLNRFEAAQARPAALGIRAPRLYLADRSREHYPGDVAVIEDVPGPTVEAMLSGEPGRARPVLGQLAAALRVIHAAKAAGFGKVWHVEAGGTARGGPCERLVLERALRDLAEASARVPRIAAARGQLEDTLRRHAIAEYNIQQALALRQRSQPAPPR